MVSWSDPANNCQDAIEAVSDNDLVRRYGVNQLDMTAIGCIRQTEANRRGRWALLTNSKDRTVNFNVGLDGAIPLPGHIVVLRMICSLVGRWAVALAQYRAGISLLTVLLM